ncbi:methylated-DNA-[protein]-cysteine S-methyltransferase [Mucilaginibacter gracilis]|uniref:Methylated-DNA--protein-cysteine methyltransferase n=1 Tax=Mucilaginibacter gracilis TaxID=423350 RepID=A0A495J131_9SPHI|nr:methylated-DNA--[protein]-cysteine S-methyltransferase [Mucilaginibacter gracilis]RKR82695.1 methylated-DNA-[protein]-cysteine S-methyltransferase [Mucilaginibacter gracilis]
MQFIFHQTPLGIARITETDGFISAVSVLDNCPEDEQCTSPLLQQAANQLDEYFAGTRRAFDFPFKQNGTDFQQQVWHQLMNIGYAETISYTQQSQRMQNPLAIRAIAAANGKNNLWIIVPCHRVIGANGSLTGYAGGIWRKKWLLQHEAMVAGIGQTKLAF